MRGAVLFAAGLFTGLAVHVAMAQSAGTGVSMMNHVGINVPNMDEAVTYYTQKMGYREAFRVNNADGRPRLVYMQISKSSFLELQPATAQQPAGFTHYGLVVDNAAAAVSAFRSRGLTVTDVTKSDTKVNLANITDPYMGRVELVEITPDSLHNKAIQSWQQRGGTPQADNVPPVNSGPNPYRVIRDWAQLTLEARPWGGSNGVAVDRDGTTVWATDRCSAGTTPGCVGSTANPVHHFDAAGKEIRSFGSGMFVWPHGIHVDRDGNVWVTDSRGEGGKGSRVVKFTPEGKVLLTLAGLTDPTVAITDPRNGDVYVAESHTDVADPNLIGRISVFDKSGKLLRIIGKTGTGPGEFRTPHGLAFDSTGRLVVADRHNHRIQILTKDGTFVREYDGFGRTSGLAIDRNDVIYTADSESTERVHPGWQRGIRIGGLADGKVTAFIPPHATPNSPDGAMGEGIAVDAAGNIYTAEAQLRGITKYVRN